MKPKNKVITILLLVFTIAWITPQKALTQGVSVGFQVFYDELSPYGTWVSNPDYGYVWIPDAGPGFVPYSTNGYWVFTTEGWTWVSYYRWGWAPFHYGRWYIDESYGAIWVPDYEWGPGWVTWRRSTDYYGWAPIGPGVSINVAYGNGYNVPSTQWTFVRNQDFGRRNINNYYVNQSNNITIINNSTTINNIRVNRSRNVTYNAGPERTEVERRVGKIVTMVSIKESNRPAQNLNNNQLQIYRPRVQRTVSSGPQPAPARVERLENVKTPAQRGADKALQKADQQVKQAQDKQRTNEPQRQQPSQQQQQQQQQRIDQPARQQPKQQQQQHNQPPRQQPQQQVQPVKQQPKQQQQQPAQPPRQQPKQEQQQRVQPAKQQPKQQQQQTVPARQQPAQQQPPHPSKNTEKGKESPQTKPPKSMGG